MHDSGAIVPRERGNSSLRGAQRRSNPLFPCWDMDCFASLAMTTTRWPS